MYSGACSRFLKTSTAASKYTFFLALKLIFLPQNTYTFGKLYCVFFSTNKLRFVRLQYEPFRHSKRINWIKVKIEEITYIWRRRKKRDNCVSDIFHLQRFRNGVRLDTYSGRWIIVYSYVCICIYEVEEIKKKIHVL